MSGHGRVARVRATYVVAAILVALGAAACGGEEETGGSAAQNRTAGDPSKDKLAQVLGRGTLILFTDPEYPPQSFAVKGGKRASDTKCASNELTASEVAGYD